MGHWNTQFTDMFNLETYPQGQSYLHPEPCIFYGSVANYPQPDVHSAAPERNFNYLHMPEYHGSNFYMMPQYNGIQPQRQVVNLDLSVAAPCSHYNPYSAPSSDMRDFHLEASHGACDELSLSLTQRIDSAPTHSYGTNMQYMDGARGSFKRHTVEGVPSNNHYHAPFMGPSSSESDVPSVNSTSFMPPEYGGNGSRPMVESGSCPSVRNRPGGPESNLFHNTNQLIHGNYVPSSVPSSGNPWLDLHSGTNNGDIGMYAWTQAPELPFMCASMNGACVEARNLSIQGYHGTFGNQSSYGFLHPSIPQCYSNSHYPPSPPMQEVRGQRINFPPPVAPSSHGFSAISALNNGINPFQDAVDARPSFLARVPQPGIQFYQPHRREILPDSNARHHNFPHLRVLPEDEVAILEIPRHPEAGNFMDRHMDMRMDIDHMSYEELLALGEHIGSVGTGLSEKFIQKNLKTRTFTSMSGVNLEEAPSLDDQIDFCVICQTDYEVGETNGTLDCGHEYHHECIKKWLLIKNSCPICKSTAFSGSGKDK